MDEQLFSLAFAARIFPDLLRACGITVVVTIAAFALSASLGLVMELTRRSLPGAVSRTIDFAARFIRGTPVLAQIFFVYFGLPDAGIKLSPMACGILVFGVHYACYTVEIYRAGLDAVPRTQWDAASALGLSVWDTYVRVILGQAIPPMILPLGNYLVAMFKETPLLAMISVAEMLTVAKLIGSEYFRYIEPLTLAGALFLVMSLCASAAIHWANRKFNHLQGNRA